MALSAAGKKFFFFSSGLIFFLCLDEKLKEKLLIGFYNWIVSHLFRQKPFRRMTFRRHIGKETCQLIKCWAAKAVAIVKPCVDLLSVGQMPHGTNVSWQDETCGLYYKSFMIINYASVCSIAYDHNLQSQLTILTKAKLGLYNRLQS